MIQIRTLGAIELRRDNTDVRSVLSQPRRFALLLHLVLAAPGGGHISRDRLLGLLWPESDEERARNALRQALHYLRQSLGDDVLTSGGGRDVGVNPAAVWCDALVVREQIRDGRLQEALELYRGDFLAGFFVDDAPEVERWIDEQRAELRTLAVRAATSLAERAEAGGEATLAVLHARRAVTLDPMGEAGVRRLMRVLAASGERAAAVEAYLELERALAQELELGVSPETRVLAAAIRAEPPPARVDARAREVAALANVVPPPSAEPPPAGAAVPASQSASLRASEAESIGDGRAMGGAVQRPRFARAGVAAAAVLVLVLGAWYGRSLLAPPVFIGPASVAVLPFVNMSGDVENDYFSDGITEELLNVLAGVPGLRVAARTSSFSFRGRDVPIDSIARVLGVTHVVEGSVRASGARLRITAQLIEARQGFHVWSKTYDREVRDIFEVQDEISRAIATKLQLELGGDLFGAAARETRDPEAYRLLLRAVHALRTPTADSYAHATMLLEDALRRDPRYARAHGSLASTLVWQGESGWAPRDSSFARARALAHRGLELGETPEAHLALARLAETQAHAPDSADAHFRRALELNPSDARTLQFRALFLARSGRGDEAIASALRATELDPLHPGAWSNYSTVLGMLDRNDEALAALEQARKVAPDDRIVLTNLANQYAMNDRMDEAVATIGRVVELYPDDLNARGLRVHLLFRAGRTAEAIDARAELERNHAFPRTRLAYLYAPTQDIDRILDLLEEAARRREPDIAGIRAPQAFRGLRHHPRFVKLLETVGGT